MATAPESATVAETPQPDTAAQTPTDTANTTNTVNTANTAAASVSEPAPATDVAEPTPVAGREMPSDLREILAQINEGDVESVPEVGGELTDPRELERPGDRAAVVVESTGAVNFDPEFASFGARAQGALIDHGILSLAVLPGAVVVFKAQGAVKVLGVLLALVGFALVARAYTNAVARSGQWIGNRVAGTKVVNVSNGKLIDRPHALTRFVVRSTFSPIFLGGYLMALTNQSKRTFHDQAAESIVTRPPRETWSLVSDD